ncbi:MAG: hypothetical protein MUE85_10720 [Microscillaceae bacterium]|jgi:hypothetical protein|nr:hypothetical protein [Microscillaceae bacterium]
MIRKPFEQWLFEEVELTFGIDRVENLPSLIEWLTVPNVQPLSQRLEQLRIDLMKNVEMWNEDELKLMFIAMLLGEIRFNNLPHYKVFTQRLFTLQTPEVEATGRVEWFVATGKQIPRKPFFFLQEYKPEKNSGNDPLGATLDCDG